MSDEKNTPEATYVEASAPAVVAGSGRRSHLCCGCCCDTRRATIIVNVINIFLVALQLLGLAAIMNVDGAVELDDDSFNNTKVDFPTWFFVVLGLAALAFSGLGIFGAKNYHPHAVLAAGSWYTVLALLALVELNIGNVIYCGFFAYPHFVFYNEMREGVMTEENYPNEKHSCCCV